MELLDEFSKEKQNIKEKTQELSALEDLSFFLESFLKGDHYVSKREYRPTLQENEKLEG